MQLEIIILSEVSQKEKEKYQVTSLICGTLSTAQMDLSTNRNRLKETENRLVFAKGEEVW